MPDKKNKQKKVGGRKKGTPNKTTAAVKMALEMTFDGIGGIPAMIAWAKNPKNRALFYQLYARMLPKTINSDGDLNLSIRVIDRFAGNSSDDGNTDPA